MTAFWILAALLVAGCMAWLLAPLLAPGMRPPTSGVQHATGDPSGLAARRADLLQRYRTEIDELDEAKRDGTLDAPAYASARRALDRRLLDESDALPAGRPPGASLQPGSPWLAGMLLAAIPAGAILLYLQLGNPLALIAAASGDDGRPAISAATGQMADMGAAGSGGQGGHAASNAALEAMVARLAFRLRDEPEDAQGWYMLARSYGALERFADAAAAYGRAVALVPDSAPLRADYADALASAGGGTLEGPPMVQIEAALDLDPDEPKALALAASAAMARGDTAAAVGFWERLQRLLPPDSRTAERIAANLAAARTGMLTVSTSATSATDATAGPSGATPQRPAAAADTAQTRADASIPATAAPGSAAVNGTVVLAPSGDLRARPGDTLYVIARPTDGSRMPLAVWRQQITSLPVAFTLDDTLAMTPGRPLSGQREVLLEARLSASGKATPQAGDRVGKSGAVPVGSSGIRIVIDSVAPGR